MNDWKVVETENDIEELLDCFHGFHDSIIKSIAYESGNYVMENNAMVFAIPGEYELHVVFEGQWEPKRIELCFNGVRRLHLIGLEDNYTNDILDAYLAFHNDLLPSKYRAPNKVIVWADDSCFEIKNISNALEEPSTTYIIASSLKWRILEE